MMKGKYFIGIISLFAAMTVSAQRNVIDQVIWVVGDEAILRSDVEYQRLQMQNEGISFEGDPYCALPELIAVQKLFLSQAKIDSIDVDESAVIRYVDRWINYAKNQYGSQEKMEEYTGKKMVQIREDQKKIVREQFIVDEMKKKIVGDIKLTPADVQKFYNQIPKDSLPIIPLMVEVEVIMMEPRIPIEDEDAIKARLRTFTEQVLSGEAQFSYLAIRYSEDFSTSSQGGETGFRSKIELEQDYATAAFALNDPARVSPVVKTEYGWHIIQLIEKRGDRINTRHILLRPKVSDQEMEKAIARLDTLYTDINAGKISFGDAATWVSSDKDTRNNKGLMVNKNEESRNAGTPKFEMEDLPLGMGVIVDKLEVGEISKPFRMKNAAQQDVVAIVRLKSRTPAHVANVNDDYLELKYMVENKKREEILQNWIVGKQKTTYIRITDGWRSCDFRYPGWIKE